MSWWNRALKPITEETMNDELPTEIYVTKRAFDNPNDDRSLDYTVAFINPKFIQDGDIVGVYVLDKRKKMVYDKRLVDL